jgi:TctA family transporter
MDFLDLASVGHNVGVGLATAASLSNLLHAFIGVTLGMFVGALPGIGALLSMSLLFPLTFYLDPVSAIIMLAGIYYGCSYGGSISSILLNLPGEPSTAITCLDGYQMSKQGRAGVALLMTTVGSFLGASTGIVALMLLSPVIAAFAVRFSSAEYFALMVLGLLAASTISAEAPLKGLAMVVLGIGFGTVGTDGNTGLVRFSLGFPELWDGFSLIAMSIGLFGLSEVIASVKSGGVSTVKASDITLRSMLPTADDMRRSWAPILRGSGIGSVVGSIPGIGATTASLLAYTFEQRVSKQPQRFGHGAIEGVVAPETANNAAAQTAFIPTLTLGVPGSVTMALIIGVLMIHGITPGPRLVTESPELFWGVIMSFWIGNLILLILNIPLIGLWVRLLTIPYHVLYPAILVFVTVGAYVENSSTFEIWLVLFFGLFGYLMRLLGFPVAPMLLGYVLGPLMEENLRRSMMLASGDFVALFQRPVSGTILGLAVLLLIWLGINGRRTKRAATRS